MKLALYSICTLLTGLKAAFRLARDHDIGFIEIFPYRLTTVEALKRWQKEFGVKIFGIDERFTWNKTPLQVAKAEYEAIEWGFASAWWVMFGRGDDERSLNMVRELNRISLEKSMPYWLLHPDVIQQMGTDTFEYWRTRIPIAVENERPKKEGGRIVWNPYLIAEKYRPLGCKLVLDPRHIQITNRIKGLKMDQFQVFREVQPDILHFNYGEYEGYGMPPPEVLEQWLKEFQRHQPEFLVLEINPSLQPKRRLRETNEMLRPWILEASRDTQDRKEKLAA